MTVEPTRPKRKYQRYWDIVKQTKQLTVTMEEEGLEKRYIKAIKKEKLADPKYRYLGYLRFSYFGTKLIVRYICYEPSTVLEEIPDIHEVTESKDE